MKLHVKTREAFLYLRWENGHEISSKFLINIEKSNKAGDYDQAMYALLDRHLMPASNESSAGMEEDVLASEHRLFRAGRLISEAECWFVQV